MAELGKGRIVCTDDDPSINIRIPAQLMLWTFNAAQFRGITMEELICDTLFINFYRELDEYGRVRDNDIERSRRAAISALRASNRPSSPSLSVYAAHEREGRDIELEFPKGKLVSWDTWTKYQELRAENINKLLKEELLVVDTISEGEPSRLQYERDVLLEVMSAKARPRPDRPSFKSRVSIYNKRNKLERIDRTKNPIKK